MLGVVVVVVVVMRGFNRLSLCSRFVAARFAVSVGHLAFLKNGYEDAALEMWGFWIVRCGRRREWSMVQARAKGHGRREGSQQHVYGK